MANRCTSSADAFALLGTKAKPNSPWRARPTLLAVALAGAFAAGAALAQTLPTGGIAIHGQASISKPAPNQLVVTTQNGAGTGHSAINWQSFSLSAGTSTQFIQPGATSLSINRVVTNTPSAIFGNLSSNGRLVLVNQSGITVGAGAVVDTAGFTASALRMTDADALAGRLRFGASGGVDAMGGGAGLTIDGRITARDGDIVLIAPQIGVGTSALVQAPNGSTILAAGQQVEITGRGLEGISLLVQARGHEARNLGRLEGGAVGIFAGTLRHSGEIQATTATLDGGTIVLKASDDAYVEGGGKLLATGGRGGGIAVLGNQVAVTDQALVDASGRIAGGNIRIGGDFQGKNPDVSNAEKTFLGPEASLRADATDTGNGGRIIVWADNQTQAYGSISARGGPGSGDGGFVEVSGKKTLAFAASVDTRAGHGLTGTLLLDPRHIIVAIVGVANPGDVDQFADLPGTTQTISPATLNAIGANVVLQATENINFNDTLNLATLNASLTALAGGIITVDAAINTNQGDVTLYANAPGSGGPGPSGSAVRVNASVNSNGGNIVLRSDGSAAAISLLLNGNVNTGAGSLALVGGGGLISQTAGSVTVGGPSTINAGSSDALLGVTSNDFSSVDITAAHITLVDTNALTVTSRSQLADSNLYLQAGGTLAVPAGAIDTGTAQLSLLSGAGGLTTPGELSGSDILLSGATNLTLAHNVAASGNMTLLSGGSMLQSAGTSSTAAGAMGVNAVGNLTVQGGAGAPTQMRAVGDQTITAFGIQVLGGAGGSNASAAIASTGAGSSQSITVTGGANFIIAGGSGAGSGNSAIVSSAGIAQTVTFLGGGNLQVNGGSVGTSHHAELISSAGGSTQTVTGAGGITVTGGTSGGGLGVGNYARIASFGDQIIDVDSGGLTLMGGSGTGIETGNSANVEHNGGAGTRQDITVNGTGFISVTGGSSTLTGVGDGNGSHASIRSDLGDSQMIVFSGSGVVGRTISLTGGTIGSDAYAEIYAGAGTQDITGARQITLTGGASGGGVTDVGGTTHGNLAVINAEFGTQTIIADGISLQGGAGGTNNLAAIVGGADQFVTVGSGGLDLTGGGGSSVGELKNAAIVFKSNDVAGTSQTISVGDGGAITLQGGTASNSNVGFDANLSNISNGAFASIRSDGVAQLIEFTAVAGGSIDMTGGTLGSDNHAKIEATSGTQTIQGDIAAHAPAISLLGGLDGVINEGNLALIIAVAGNQDISAASINLTGGATGNENLAQLRQGNTTGAGDSSTQTVTIMDGGDLTMQGGGGNFNVARIRSHGTIQLIRFSAPGSNIDMTGGGAGTDNIAQIVANNGSQTIEGLTAADAPTISLQGGNAGVGNLAQITAQLGSQTVSVGDGGLSLTGGSGVRTDLRNFASVFQGGLAGTSQTINVGGGGDITLQAGTSAGFGIGVNNGSLAYITNQGDQQLVEFSEANSTLRITGGSVGSYNAAGMFVTNGNQIIRGTDATRAPNIVLAGGISDGIPGEGNLAELMVPLGSQTIEAASITITGGAAGTENMGRISQNGSAGFSQSITIVGGGAVNLQGGGGITNLAQFRSLGDTQTVNFASGGTLNLTGGTGASLNYARIEAVNGSQSVIGSPDITISGGASGGAAALGNFAQIRSRPGTQLVTATSLTIKGGVGGVENDGGIRADGNQTISLQTAGSNAIVIGAAGSANISFITGPNQVITAGAGVQSGMITIHGGTGSGKNAGIFANPITPSSGTQTIATTGALTLIGGSATGTASTCDPATGGGSCADINNSGTGLQRITAATVHLQGGNGGLASGAGIFGQGGNMELNIGAGGLTLLGGAGGTSNFATIGGASASGSTMTINVIGDTVLDARNATDGSGTLIGLGGTGAGGSITIDFNGTGDLDIFGSNTSPNLAGAGIGTGSNRSGATSSITVDAASITLTAGSQSRAQIGHKAGNGGLGDITANATGNINFNANGAVEASVRTGGNVVLVAGGSITQNASATDLPIIEANLLTASANGGSILLDSAANLVGSLNATVPLFNGGDLFFTNAPGTLLTVTGVTMAGSKTARITADDLNITGPVSNIGGPVVLRPLDGTRNVHIESSPTAGVLSLSPADLQQVTSATVLEIGRLDGTGSLTLIDSLANGNISAGTLRLLTGTDFFGTSGASLGTVGTEFDHHVELRANNNLQLTSGNMFLANNRILSAFADNDGSTVGSVNIGAGIYKVGTGAGNTTGLMDIKGADISVAVSGGGSSLVEVTGSGLQTFTATDFDLRFLNQNAASGNLQVRTNTGDQNLAAAAGSLTLQAGTGTGNGVSVGATAGRQIINADTVRLQGGASGFGNTSSLFAGGAAQTLNVAAGPVSLTGGGGTGADGNNAAFITYSGTGTQSISIASATGDLTLTGGNSAAPGVGAGNGSRAVIESAGAGNQTILLSGGDLTLQGGSVGNRNFSNIVAQAGTQTISGAASINMTGGATGGGVGNGNGAYINSESGSQSISAGAITLTGGAADTENLAQIRQGSATGGLGATQIISVLGNGALRLNGGTGASNLARVQAFGTLQSITMGAGAALGLTGGTGASNNFARIQAVNGNQTIAGRPNITINGGASGGADLAGNFADIRAGGAASVQTIAADNITLQAGAAGQENFAVIQAPNQTITALGSLTLTGGGSAASLDGTVGGGARIGGIGGATPSATNLDLTVGTNATLTGGSVSLAALGSGLVGGQITNIIVDATGSITLNPGSVVTAGSRIGSPAGGLAGGDILLTAGGSIVLNGATAGETAVRTLGDVTLDAAALGIGNRISGATIFANASGAVSITGVGQLNATAPTGDSIEVVVGSAFTNTAGPTALVTTAPARWLVYSNDPASDNRGGLVYGFKQFAKSFGDANPVLGSGNGFLYTIAPTAIVSLTGSVVKVYDGTDVATLAAGNFLAAGGVDGDVVSVGSGATGSYDTRHVGAGKTISVSGVAISALDGTKPVFGYALAGGAASGAIGAITAAPLTVSTTAVNRPYDATPDAPGALAIATLGSVFAGDTLSGGTFAFLDSNVGTGKTVTVSGVTVNDGNSGLNYTLTQANNTNSSISALAAANWSGLGGNSLWSNPANWDVLPLAGNVLSVAIPAGTGTVVFDMAAGTTSLQSLSSQQPISVTGGNLLLGASMNTPSLSQSGGNLRVGNTLTAGSVSQSAGTMQVDGALIAGNFSQTGGAISGTGAMTIANGFNQSSGGSVSMGSIIVNQSSGNLVFANLTAPTITLSAPAGMIGQTGPMHGAAVSTASLSGAQLNNPSNQIGALVALNTGSGNIALVNSGALVIGAMANAGGNIDVTNTGAIATAGPVSAPAGDVTIIANSPLTVGAGGIFAGGSVVLHATNLTSAGNLTLDGAVLSGNTVSLTADSNLVQNFAVVGGNGVTASAGGSMTFGPFATTNAPPILYTAGGLPVTPPPAILASALQPPGDILLTFLDLLDDVINGPRGDSLETNPDGSKKKKELQAIVSEGEVCR